MSLQHYCGWLPDYFRGELALRGAACCGFVLPMALSGYLGYTGDLSFLCEEINYSEYVGGSLDRAEKSIIFDTAYEHAVRSILCVPSNEYGLPHFEHQGSVFETMGIAGEFSDIAAALFLRKSIESMLEYASDCRLRLKLVEIERKLTDGIRKAIVLPTSKIIPTPLQPQALCFAQMRRRTEKGSTN